MPPRPRKSGVSTATLAVFAACVVVAFVVGGGYFYRDSPAAPPRDSFARPVAATTPPIPRPELVEGGHSPSSATHAPRPTDAPTFDGRMRLRCDTTVGRWDIETRPDWSPHGAGRMLQLAQLDFFTNMTFFRVPPLASNPIAQFGATPSRGVTSAVAALGRIPDDPMLGIPVKPGYFGFGGSGKNSRSSHLWVARADFFGGLGKNPWDTPVARIVNADGIESVSKIAQVGDMKPWGKGPDTARMVADPTFHTDFPGNYLRTNYPNVDWFKGCVVVSSFE